MLQRTSPVPDSIIAQLVSVSAFSYSLDPTRTLASGVSYAARDISHSILGGAVVACLRASKVSLKALWHGGARGIICRPLGERIVNSSVNSDASRSEDPNIYELLTQRPI